MMSPDYDIVLDVSVIIPSRNRPQLLLDCVHSILDGDRVPAELIIVDQSDTPNSTLAALTRVNGSTVRYRWSQTIGTSLARNEGIDASLHPITVFTDDDVFVASDWLGALVTALINSGPKAVVTGLVLPGEPETPGGFAPSTVFDTASIVYQGRIKKDVLFSGNMALWRSTFNEVGRFDPCLGPGTSCFSAEDNDLAFRLLEAGYRIVYSPAAAVHHRAWRTSVDIWRVKWNYAVGQGAFYSKHRGASDRYMLNRLLSDVVVRVKQLVVSGPRRDWRGARSALICLAGTMYGAWRWRPSHPEETN